MVGRHPRIVHRSLAVAGWLGIAVAMKARCKALAAYLLTLIRSRGRPDPAAQDSLIRKSWL